MVLEVVLWHVMGSPSAWPGCHVGEVMGRRPYSRRSLNLRSGQQAPEIALEPGSHLMSFVNAADEERAYFVSVRRHGCCGGSGRLLASSGWLDEHGRKFVSTNFVVRVAPREVAKVCTIVGLKRQRDLSVCSDIVPVLPPPTSSGPPLVLGFPLAPMGAPYRCSQAAGGALTHFAHPSTWHAIDLDAALGTPVVAAADGTIVGVKDGSDAGGGADTSLFFAFNSLTQLLSDGTTTVEYVHIRARSARVKIGEVVTKGQMLCESGDAGFCPTAHLHIEAHHRGREDPAAPSIPIAFACDAHGKPAFECIAGRWYDPTRGEVPQPTQAMVGDAVAASVRAPPPSGRVAEVDCGSDGARVIAAEYLY